MFDAWRAYRGMSIVKDTSSSVIYESNIKRLLVSERRNKKKEINSHEKKNPEFN